MEIIFIVFNEFLEVHGVKPVGGRSCLFKIITRGLWLCSLMKANVIVCECLTLIKHHDQHISLLDRSFSALRHAFLF